MHLLHSIPLEQPNQKLRFLRVLHRYLVVSDSRIIRSVSLTPLPEILLFIGNKYSKSSYISFPLLFFILSFPEFFLIINFKKFYNIFVFSLLNIFSLKKISPFLISYHSLVLECINNLS